MCIGMFAHAALRNMCRYIYIYMYVCIYIIHIYRHVLVIILCAQQTIAEHVFDNKSCVYCISRSFFAVFGEVHH